MAQAKLQKKFYLSLICLAVITYLIAALTPKAFIDSYYTNGIYPLIRVIYDHTLGYLPFASVYLILPLMIAGLVYVIVRWFKDYKDKKIMRGALRMFALLAVYYSMFYWFWGFNYYGYDLKESLFPQFQLPEIIEVERELQLITTQLISTRDQITTDTNSLTFDHLPKNLETTIRKRLISDLADMEINTAGRVRVRNLKPTGILLRFSTAGVYLPFAFEGHIDNGLHPIQWPATMAHEMSHGYSVTDEGECNFTGILACLNSENAFIRYSGLLSYWKYLYRVIKKTKPDERMLYYSQLTPAVLNDLDAIDKQMDKFPDIMPTARNIIYDTYLKSHGVSKGLDSYGTVVDMMISYKKLGLR